MIKSMKLGGVGLEDIERAKVNDINLKLAKLSTTFSNNSIYKLEDRLGILISVLTSVDKDFSGFNFWVYVILKI